jgi:hypothetical protein
MYLGVTFKSAHKKNVATAQQYWITERKQSGYTNRKQVGWRYGATKTMIFSPISKPI